LLIALIGLAGCRLLAPGTPCVADDNCLQDERCEPLAAMCVPASPDDAGAARVDGGPRLVDAGAPTTDAGTATSDAGTATPDAGTAAPDAGTSLDAGPSGFAQRRRFDIDTAQLTGDLTDFPLPLDLADTGTSVGDFTITAPDGTPLDFEVEQTSPLFVWTRVPTISTVDTDAHVWVWFGNNSGTPSPPRGDVWRDYLAVFHLADPPDTSPASRDSSGDANHGTFVGTFAPDDLVGGVAGSALDLDGSSQYIDLGTGMAVSPQGPLTVEAWVRVRSPGAGNSYLISKTGLGGNRGLDLSFNDYGPDSTWIEWRTYLDGSNGNGTGEVQLTLDEWHHAAGTFAGGQPPRLFLDGTEVATAAGPWPAGAQLFNSTEPLAFGARPDVTGYVPGTIDEVRISTVERSAAYLHATWLVLAGNVVTPRPTEAAP
jgi:hypothetical protein